MQSIQVRRIRNALAEIRQRGNYTRLEPPHLMMLTRQLLESQQLQNRFPVVKLYGDWCAHCEISRSSLGFRILQDLSLALNQDHRDNTVSIADPNGGASQALAITALRDQMSVLFEENGLESWPFSKLQFPLFMGAILDAIEDSPISFPDPLTRQAQPYYDRAHNAACGNEKLIVVRASVTKNLGSEQLSFYKVPEGTFAWQIETAAEVRYVGILYAIG